MENREGEGPGDDRSCRALGALKRFGFHLKCSGKLLKLAMRSDSPQLMHWWRGAGVELGSSVMWQLELARGGGDRR